MRSARPPTRRLRPRSAAGSRQAPSTGWPRRFGVTVSASGGAAGDRLEGADRLAAAAPRVGAGDIVVIRSWPTRRTRSALGLAGEVVAADSTAALGPRTARARLAELAGEPDRPGPTARAPSQGVAWCAERGALWSPTSATSSGLGGRPVSVLHPDVCGGSFDGILAVHSLSKRSNLAGYRARSWPGTPRSSPSCSRSARTSACMMPGPMQTRWRPRSGTTQHVEVQRARYARGATSCARAFEGAGFRSTTPRRRSTCG